MPWVSRQQEKWGNSPAGKKALGQKTVDEFNRATKGKKLPRRSKTGRKRLKRIIK